MPLNLFYTMVQKSQKWPKTQIKGGGSCLKRAKTPGECPFQGRNSQVKTSNEGGGREKLETRSFAVPSEVRFLGKQSRSCPQNLFAV